MTRGAVGKRLVDNDMLLLTTVGRSSRSPHTVPLLYLAANDRLIVVASYGGRDHHPEWYRNLVTTPNAHVQVRGRVRRVIATTMSAADRSAWWPRFVEAYGGYATYQSLTDREIPLVWLDPDPGN
jgi:deazaflavin-dependent oxidoreductase (nitroreductase family)